MHDVLNLRDLLGDEFTQRQEEGYDVSHLEAHIRQALYDGSDAECDRLLTLLEKTAQKADWPYHEPASDLEEILAARPEELKLSSLALREDELRDRLRGAWLGRCAGCNLGKPVEGWSRADIKRYLELAGAYPLTDYFPLLEPVPFGLQLNASWPETTQGNIQFMARDDDIDYTILGLHILETYGFDFGPENVAREWLTHFPFLSIYTAERAAYRNLIERRWPPQSALHRNPYREWIGAQIRADIWGYVSPGDPERAARLAFQDASLSHVKNGIYGEMWAAALMAASFVAQDSRQALEAALAQVPRQSRLAEALHDVFALYDRGLDWEQARDAIEQRYYAKYSFVHTIQNAALVAMALLWGAGDYTRTIGLAVQGGWDTDCNGATAGSAFGILHGTQGLPGSWIDPLHDFVRSSVSGYDNSRISDLAERTLPFALTNTQASRKE